MVLAISILDVLLEYSSIAAQRIGADLKNIHGPDLRDWISEEQKNHLEAERKNPSFWLQLSPTPYAVASIKSLAESKTLIAYEQPIHNTAGAWDLFRDALTTHFAFCFSEVIICKAAENIRAEHYISHRKDLVPSHLGFPHNIYNRGWNFKDGPLVTWSPKGPHYHGAEL